MTDSAGEPGDLIGRGRAADVYALADGRVLRRYRTVHRSEAEAGLMRYLRRAGFPVPEVFGADGPDLIMERLAGPTMLDDMARRPWRPPALPGPGGRDPAARRQRQARRGRPPAPPLAAPLAWPSRLVPS